MARRRQSGMIVGCLALVALVVLGCLAGCDPTAQMSVQPKTTEGRRFSIPAAYFGDQDQEAIESGLKKLGAFDIEVGSDGAYTVTMNNTDYDAFMEDNHQTTEDVINAICGSQDFKSISRVSMDDNFNNISFTSRVDDPGDQAEKAARIAIYYACLYQVLAGDPLVCTVRVNGPAGNLIGTWSYPEFGKNLEDSANALS